MRVTARCPPCDSVRFKYHGPMIGGTKKSGSISSLYVILVPSPSGSSSHSEVACLKLLPSGKAVLLIQRGSSVSSRSLTLT